MLPRAELADRLAGVVAALAPVIAKRLIWCEAVFSAVYAADKEDKIRSLAVDPKTLTVTFGSEEDERRIAKRLPKWIKVSDAGA